MIHRVIGSVMMLTLLANASPSEIIYSNPTDTHVIGSWEFADADAVLVNPTERRIDLNHDGTPDASFAHHYIRGVNRISPESAELLRTAGFAQREIFSLLSNVQSLARDAAHEGVSDADVLAHLHAHAHNNIDTINRIAENAMYNGQKLLDGSAGIKGTASNSNVTVLNVADTVQPGTYGLTVDTAGERATYLTVDILGSNLGQDETLTVNGVTIELAEGLTRTQIMDRINLFTQQTSATAHIVADAGADLGKLRLSSVAFGLRSEIELISNVAGRTANSTTVGTSPEVRNGIDLVATIAGTQFNGQGNTVTADSGAVRGLSLSVAPVDHGDGHHVTTANRHGVINITDRSLSFPLNPSQDETAEISLRRLHSGSLGVAVDGNQFANLAEIDLTSASKAQDSLRVIEIAIDTVRVQIQNVDSMLDEFFLPVGEAFVEGIGLAEIAIVDDTVALLTKGDAIGPAFQFSDELMSIGSLAFDGRDSAFLGIRLLADEQFHYGWIRAELAEDQSLFIRDYAFESLPNQHVRAGLVPEPTGPLNILIGLGLILFQRRSR